MAKSKGSTTQVTGPDAQTQDMMKQVWAAANAAGATPGVGANAATTDAVKGFQGFANAGNLGLGAMSGNPDMLKLFMNPYQSGVIDKLHGHYDTMRAGATNDINAQATAAGAFGGSRHGVAQGVALGELGRNEGQQVAGLLDQGFNNSMGRAGQVANMGFGANQALGGLGEYLRNVDMQNDPAGKKLAALMGAMGVMPHGSTTTGTQQNGRNGVTGALGGAATGAQVGSAFGPWGTGIGAGLGGLMGLFS